MKTQISDKEDLISIIIPVYNVEKYLARCLESVINQSYTNLEILLINDGSTDSSLQICEKYAEKDSRIKIFSHKNQGLAYTRGWGIQQAKGNYISQIDSDDIIDLNFISILHSKLISTQSDFVQCNYTLVDENLNILGNDIQPKPHEKSYTGHEYLEMLYDDDIRPGNIIMWNKLYKKKLWENIKIAYGNLHDDDYVLPYIMDKANKVTVIPISLYSYVIRKGSITNLPDLAYIIKKQFDYQWVQDDRYRYFKSKKYSILSSRTIEERVNDIRNIHKNIKTLDSTVIKQKYQKKLQEDIRKYLLKYLVNKKIKIHVKFKLIQYYIGL